MFKTKIMLIVLTIVCINIPYKAMAQNWSLKKCIAYATENNIQIKQQILRMNMQKTATVQSKAALLPSVNASASQRFNYGRTVDPFTNDFSNTTVRSNDFGLSASLDLFKGGQNYHALKQSKLSFLQSLQDVERIKNDVSLNVASAYLQVLYAQEQLEVTKKQLDLSINQLERTNKLVTAGSLPKGDLLEAKAQKAAEELTVINAENNLRIAYLTLSQLLELQGEPAKNFSIENPVLPEIEQEEILLTVDMIYLEAMELPQIKSAEYEVESSKESLDIARGGRLPRLSVNLNWGTGYSDARKLYNREIGNELKPIGFVGNNTEQIVNSYSIISTEQDYLFSNQLNDNRSTSLVFRLTVPIFNKLQVQSNISYKKIEYQSSEYALQISKNALYKDIQQAHNNAIAALAEYKGSKKSLEARREAFKYLQQKFDLGMMTSVEYNTSKIQLNKAEVDLLKAKYNYIFTKNVLDFYRGKELSI